MLETTHAALCDLSVRLSTLEVDLHVTECRICDIVCSKGCPVYVILDSIGDLSYRIDDAFILEKVMQDA